MEALSTALDFSLKMDIIMPLRHNSAFSILAQETSAVKKKNGSFLKFFILFEQYSIRLKMKHLYNHWVKCYLRCVICPNSYFNPLIHGTILRISGHTTHQKACATQILTNFGSQNVQLYRFAPNHISIYTYAYVFEIISGQN